MATNILALFRIGSVQALMKMTGEGLHERPVVDFTRISAEGADPQRPWELEDILAVGVLCEEIKKVAVQLQTRVPVVKPSEEA